MLVDRPPGIDFEAPLTRLAPGQHVGGLWVGPEYARRGYESALPEVWLRVAVVHPLLIALTAARRLGGFGLLIWDAWRPAALQEELYVEYRESLVSRAQLTGEDLEALTAQFVTAPERATPPPAHSTGGALDLTLCDADNGEAIDMGGEFDELSDRTAPDYYDSNSTDPDVAARSIRRTILKDAMAEGGFVQLPTEWWHFEYGTSLWAENSGHSVLFPEPAPPPR